MKRCAVIIAILILAAACTAVNEDAAYEAANQSYHADAMRYSQARAVFVDADGVRRPGVATDAQWSRFRTAEQEVIDADQRVYDDMNTWSRTRVKPVGYDTHASALLAAQQKIITLSTEVR